MKKFSFGWMEGADSQFFKDEASYLYNKRTYLKLKVPQYGESLTYYIISGVKVVAHIHFFLLQQKDNYLKAVSLPASPFGSLDFCQALPAEVLNSFMQYIFHSLRQKGVDQITIKDCIPAYRSEDTSAYEQSLMNTGFAVWQTQQNHHILVNQDGIAARLHRMEQKRLRKCRTAGFVFRQENVSALNDHYSFLQKCRQEKGWTLSLSLNQLQQSVSAMPEAYALFSVYDLDRRIAAALTVRVNRSIMYDFYHDALAAYKNYSPVVLLVDGLYSYCQQEKISVLDLGTSPSLSLAKFKEHLGGIKSFKKTYQYSVTNA